MRFIILISTIGLSLAVPLGFADQHAKHKSHKSEKSSQKAHGDASNDGKQSKSKHHHDKNEEKHDHSDQKSTAKQISPEKIVIKVKGLVCAFCAQGIEKNFNRQEAVESTSVDLDKMLVQVHLHQGKTLAESVIKELVTNAGFAYGGFVEE